MTESQGDAQGDAQAGGRIEGQEWSVDDLARRAGTTVRNVRLYQERGLLAPPRREGRKGWYGPAHLERLRLILGMLARGYPLTAIRELAEAWEANRSIGDVLGFEAALAEPFVTEEPRRISADQLFDYFPGAAPEDLNRAFELRLIEPQPDSTDFVVPSPAFFDAGVKLVADGVPLAAVLDAAAEIRRASERLVECLVDLYLDHVWRPFVAAGMPASDLPRITDALRRQRPLVAQAVMPALAQALEWHVAEVAAAEPHLPVPGGSGAGGSAPDASGRSRPAVRTPGGGKARRWPRQRPAS